MIGSLDGYDHRLTNSTVVINGTPRNVLTRTGSQCEVNLGRNLEAQVGDVASLIGTEHPDIIANEGGAAWANYYLRQTVLQIPVQRVEEQQWQLPARMTSRSVLRTCPLSLLRPALEARTTSA
jgi:hypothetical protein